MSVEVVYSQSGRDGALIAACPSEALVAPPSVVYFVQMGADGPVKIGWSNDVRTRLKDLQCANPYELHLLREIEGPRTLEGQLHRRFDACRIRGEWFHPASTRTA